MRATQLVVHIAEIELQYLRKRTLFTLISIDLKVLF